MGQYGSVACANQGLLWPGILRKYYYYHQQSPTYVTVLDNYPGATDWNHPTGGWQVRVLALDSAGAVYYKWWPDPDTGVWLANWAPLYGSCSSAPAAAVDNGVVDGLKRMAVFCRWQDTKGLIYWRYYDGYNWGSWSAALFPGEQSPGFQSGPAATEYYQPGDGYQFRLYALGWDGKIYQNWCRVISCAWQGWDSIVGSPTGGCTSAPATDWRSSTELYVFCRSTGGYIYYKMWNGTSWSSWTKVPDGTRTWITSPGATDYYQSGDGWHQNVYGNSEVGNLWENFRNASGWSGWHINLGGSCQSAAGASDLPQPSANDYLFVFCRWDNGNIAYKRWTGTTWEGWLTTLDRP